jgi:aldose 1-epimerase
MISLDQKPEQQCHITKHSIAGSNDIFLYKLSNASVDVEVSNYGCTIVSINAPDLHRSKENIVAGFKNFSDYTKDHPYFGCVVGRYANRIAFGKFSIGDTEYVLPVNDGKNHLHGGYNGFNKKVWKPEREIKSHDLVGVQFSYKSEDGEEGYPGNLKVSVEYVLTAKDELIMNYEAVTDKPTIINLYQVPSAAVHIAPALQASALLHKTAFALHLPELLYPLELH